MNVIDLLAEALAGRARARRWKALAKALLQRVDEGLARELALEAEVRASEALADELQRDWEDADAEVDRLNTYAEETAQLLGCEREWTNLHDHHMCVRAAALCDRSYRESADWTIDELKKRLAETEEKLAKMRARKDGAYTERNRVVAFAMRLALDLGWKAGIGTHEDVPGVAWDPEWRTLVVFEIPGLGQASWHVHDSHRELFARFPTHTTEWDGHTTDEKYARLARFVAEPDGVSHRVLEEARGVGAKLGRECERAKWVTEMTKAVMHTGPEVRVHSFAYDMLRMASAADVAEGYAPTHTVDYRCGKCGATGLKLWRGVHGCPDKEGHKLKCAACLAPGEHVDGDGRQSLADEPGVLSDQIRHWLPAIPVGDTFWGYCSVPERDVAWWRSQPTYAPAPPATVCAEAT